jgi:hypothetical protein
MEKVKPNKRVLAFLLDGVSFLFIISLSKYIFKFGDYNIIINIMFFYFSPSEIQFKVKVLGNI